VVPCLFPQVRFLCEGCPASAFEDYGHFGLCFVFCPALRGKAIVYKVVWGGGFLWEKGGGGWGCVLLGWEEGGGTTLVLR